MTFDGSHLQLVGEREALKEEGTQQESAEKGKGEDRGGKEIISTAH